MNRQLAVSWTQALSEMGAILRIDEAESEELLLAVCEQEPSLCRSCGGERIYALKSGRMRCAKCLYSFARFTGRWLGRHRVKAKVWLAAIKGFELGLEPLAVSQVSRMAPTTAYELEKTIQMSLASLDGAWATTVAACDSGKGIPRAFRVNLKEGGFAIQPLDGEETEARLELPPAEGGLDALKGLRAGWRRWARLPAGRFALKLKEWELRSTSTEPLFQLTLQALVRYMPPGIYARQRGITPILHRGRRSSSLQAAVRDVVAAKGLGRLGRLMPKSEVFP